MKFNENDIKRIIAETITEVLERREKNLLLEMPLPRGEYKERVDSELPQVFINWCLTHYRTITSTTPYKKHWSGKFRGHMYTVCRFAIKGKDDVDTRKKVLEQIVEANDYNNPQFMTLTVCNKFLDEHIDIKSEAFATVIEDCINAIPTIFELILERDVEKINEYAQNI